MTFDAETTQAVPAKSVRLPADPHSVLRTYSHHTRVSLNDAVVGDLPDFMTGPAHRELAAIFLKESQETGRTVLDKLRDL